jgi:ferredoxin-NADP reductase
MAAKARDCRARVAAVRQLAPAIVEVDLRMEDPARLDFDAGQWISVPFGPKTVRAYTIASTPRDGNLLSLCADVAPAGIGSRWLAALVVGEEVGFKGPLGGFVFDRTDARRPLFVAEEIGIVAIRSIVADLAETDALPAATLVHWVPGREHLIYADELAGLVRDHPGFVYHPVVGGELGVDHFASDARVAYVAGGGALIRRVRDAFVSRGLDRKAVKWERFW